MVAKNSKDLKSTKFKIIYSLRIRILLAEMGFQPIVEMDNMLKPPLKCWKYIVTPEFEEALTQIMGGRA